MPATRYWFAGVAVWCGSAAFAAVMSPNVIVGGDFESINAIKTLDCPRTQAEIDEGRNPVRAWQFHPGGIAAENAGGYTIGQAFSDLGKWIGQYGIGTEDFPPRQQWPYPSAYATNRSLVERDGQATHVMDGVMFHASFSQVMAAPDTHVAGAATIDFSYWFNRWQDAYGLEGDSTLHVWIGGLTSLPTYADRAGAIFGGNLDGSETGSGGKWSLSPLWDSPNWTLWPWSGIGSDKPAVGSQGLAWHELSADYPSSATFTIDTPYPYYYISIYQSVATSALDPFWEPLVSSRMAVAVDNIDLRLPLAPVGDCNLDGLINALDIAPFIQYLTSGNYRRVCDVNQDGVCNTLDINPIIILLTGGQGGQQEVPEATTAGLLAIGLAVFLGRREVTAG